jgi:hypothetical protein
MSEENNIIDIRTKDLIAMVFLKTKYWGLFRDIEANRDLYTQIRLEDRRASLLFDDKDEQEYRKKHFNELFEKLGYSTKDIDLLRPLLSEIFPAWNGNNHDNDDELRVTNRIAHRDLLDLYFSYGISQQTFKRHMEHVAPIVDRVAKDKYTEKSLMRAFKEFNKYALSQEQAGDVSRLLARRLLSLHQTQRVSIEVWRCWLRALLRYESAANEAVNSVMASILSGANDSIQRSLPLGMANTSPASIVDNRVDGAIVLFRDVVDYLNNPYLALLMLLFVLPARGNSFFLDYINRHGAAELFAPVLDYVDRYFIGQKRNVFHEFSWPQWAFINYQWSLSISQGDALNTAVPNAVLRHRTVNDYVFSLLKRDNKLIYHFIRMQFWSDNNAWEGETYKWQVAGKIAQYNNETDRANILAIVAKALSSNKLTNDQRAELKEFERLFNQYVSSSPLNESSSTTPQ